MDIIGPPRNPQPEKPKGPVRLGHTINGVLMTYDLLPDPTGWIDATQFVPKEFILKMVRIKRKGIIIDQILIAWWNGSSWDGYKLKEGDVIIEWRCREDGRVSGRDAIIG